MTELDGGVTAAELHAELAMARADIGELRAELAQLRASVTDGSARFAAIYPAFEDRFRGTEAEVRERLAVYRAPVREVVRHDAGGPRVLDVGPGRGEWLAVLAEAGLPAVGVERNAGLVERLLARGLAVEQGDAIARLEGTEPGSLDAVTAFHVVEHLDLEALLALLAAARRALRPGGLLVAETPNPTNLVMGACNFHLDPTHLAPLPPAQLEFLVGAAGFTDVEIWPLHPKDDIDLSGMQLPGVTPEAGAAVALALAKGLFGPQDYAVLAK